MQEWRRDSCQMDAQAEAWGVPDGRVSGERCVLVVMPGECVPGDERWVVVEVNPDTELRTMVMATRCADLWTAPRHDELSSQRSGDGEQ